MGFLGAKLLVLITDFTAREKLLLFAAIFYNLLANKHHHFGRGIVFPGLSLNWLGTHMLHLRRACREVIVSLRAACMSLICDCLSIDFMLTNLSQVVISVLVWWTTLHDRCSDCNPLVRLRRLHHHLFLAHD